MTTSTTPDPIHSSEAAAPSVLTPEFTTVTVAGEQFQVGKFTSSQWLAASASLVFAARAALTSGAVTSVDDLMRAAPQPVLNILAVGINKPFEFVDKAPFDEVIDLAVAWWEHNGPFFVEKVLPKVLDMVKESLVLA